MIRIPDSLVIFQELRSDSDLIAGELRTVQIQFDQYQEVEFYLIVPYKTLVHGGVRKKEARHMFREKFILPNYLLHEMFDEI